MRKHQLSKALMVTTILLIALFQGYWLMKLYKDEYNSLKKDADVTFRETVYKLQRAQFEKDTLLFKRRDSNAVALLKMKSEAALPFAAKMKHAEHAANASVVMDAEPTMPPQSDSGKRNFTFNITRNGTLPPEFVEVMMMQKSLRDSITKFNITSDELKKINPQDIKNIRVYNQDGRQGITIITSHLDSITSANLKKHLSSKLSTVAIKDSVKHELTKLEKRKDWMPSPIINYLSTNKTVNDSIPLKLVDSTYKSELTKSKKNLPCTILFQPCLDKRPVEKSVAKDTGNNFITSKVYLGFNTPYSYQASFVNVPQFILGKMQLQIVGSVLLLCIVCFAFISLNKNLNEQRRLAIIKNDFISNITHELKTPIATVTVAIEALRNFNALQSPERTKEYLDISALELQRLSMLVDKVLKLSMFENKEIDLQKDSFDVKQLAEEVINGMRLQFDKQKATVSLQTKGDNFTINADRLHITSVLYNLLDNALKYSNSNAYIQVILVRNNDEVEILVADNGKGISHEYQDKIFEKFFRVPSGDHHNIKGYGLGLSYVAHITDKHKGSIHVQSEVGKGSTFVIKLPVT